MNIITKERIEELKEENKNYHMHIALIGRHSSPDDHIVLPDGIPEDRMTDYDWMQNQCYGWLVENHMGVPTQLFVEGITPLLVAFLKMWTRCYGVDAPTLNLFHYQPDGTYAMQSFRAFAHTQA